jgi:redox-regulated HSP33 family molecular chaperone
VIADAKLRYGKVKFQVCNAENLKFNGKIVLEFGGKNNVKTIVDQLRSSLKKRGYLNQSKLELWYFPSAEEYSKELELVGL